MDVDQLRELFACLANCRALNDSGEPDALSLAEIRSIGEQGLDIIDGEV
jgi:hypothetical protein